MISPEVSVVVAVYNAESRVEGSLRSVLDSTGVCLELIVVDDGSTDGSAELIATLARQDTRMRVLHQAHAGLTVALQAGCAAARAPLIARHDIGMRCFPERLRAQVRNLDVWPAAVLSTCGVRETDAHFNSLGVVSNRRLVRSDKDAFDLHPAYHVVTPNAHGSVVFRREAYERAGGYRSEFRYAQDLDLWLRLIELGPFVEVEEVLTTRTLSMTGTSLLQSQYQSQLADCAHASARARRRGDADMDIMTEAVRISRDAACRTDGIDREVCADGHYYLGSRLAVVDSVESRRQFRAALWRKPWHVKAWLKLCSSFVVRA